MSGRYWHREALTGLIEVTASEQPTLLAALVEILQNGVAWHTLAELADRWGLGLSAEKDREKAGAELVTAVQVATAKLNGLERRHVRLEVDSRGNVLGARGKVVNTIPNVGMVFDLAAARSGRPPASRADKLTAIMRKLAAAVESEATGRMIKRFMSEDEDAGSPDGTG